MYTVLFYVIIYLGEDMSKYCKKCGRKIDENDIFCQYCGTQLIEETPEGEPIVSTNKTNSLAIAGFVVSLVSFVFSFWGVTAIVAIILSSVALSQIKKNNEGGKGLALAGLIIGIVSVIVGFFSLIFIGILALFA